MPLPHLDHVNLAVPDLDEFERIARDRYGLGMERLPDGSVAHIPLAGTQYIEIHAPGAGVMGQLMARMTRGGARRWWGWSAEVADIRSSAARVGSTPVRFVGTLSPWSGEHAATEQPRASGALPYLIAYDQDVAARAEILREKRERTGHDVEVGGIGRVDVGTTAVVLEEWIGGHIDEARCLDSVVGVGGVTIVLDGTEVAFDVS